MLMNKSRLRNFTKHITSSRDLGMLVADVRKVASVLATVREKQTNEDRLVILETKVNELAEQVQSDLNSLQEWVKDNQAWREKTGNVVEFLLQKEKERDGRVMHQSSEAPTTKACGT